MDSFKTTVDGWVASAAVVARDFGEVVRALPGVYPADALASLLRLQSTGHIPEHIVRSMLSGVEAAPKSASVARRLDCLPIPHPLDYDWRFTVSTREGLLEVVASHSRPGDTVVLLATPSLVTSAAARLGDRRIVLLEQNQAALAQLHRLELIRYDAMFDPLPELSAQVVVVDPPWYEEHIQSFIWAAACLCKPEGHIFLSFPATGTRPGVSSEFDRLEQWASRLGLARVRTEYLALGYDSPYFERNALSALGIRNVPDDWRRANLVVFQTMGDVAAERPGRAGEIELWDEFSLGTARIKVRRRAFQGFRNPSLKKLVRGDILPTVSRRTSIRASVDVWTTGNRVYRCEAPALLLEIGRAIAARTDPSTSVQSFVGRRLTRPELSLVCQATEQLLNLAHREDCEVRDPV